MSRLKRLVNNSKGIRNFLLYALGELFLIVIGIYIALQLDDWKIQKDRHANEIEVLSEIIGGFDGDISDINFNISMQERAIRSGELILAHLDKNLPYHDSLSYHFATTLWYSRFVANEGPLEDLKSKGLDIITNDSLRLKITMMYLGSYEGMSHFEKNTFLPDAYILEVNATRFDKTEIYSPSPSYEPRPGKMIPLNYNKLRSDKTYIHVLKSGVSKNKFLVNYFMKPILKKLSNLRQEVVNERARLSQAL